METPLRIIIEGCNYAGKDAILAALSPLTKNSITIQTRGYFRRALQETFHLSSDETLHYFRERADAFVKIARAVRHEELIFMRLHLTDIVYSKLYLDAVQDYSSLETELNTLNIGLILLDIDDASLAARAAAAPRGTSGHTDRSLDGLIKKRDLYREAFAASKVLRRLHLNNSNGGLLPEQQAKKIIEWWGQSI